MIEKKVAVCQSKAEANHWVELLRKHMSKNSTLNVGNQKMSPSQVEIVPQPPPHVSLITLPLSSYFINIYLF